MLAKAGNQRYPEQLDSRLHGNERIGLDPAVTAIHFATSTQVLPIDIRNSLQQSAGIFNRHNEFVHISLDGRPHRLLGSTGLMALSPFALVF